MKKLTRILSLSVAVLFVLFAFFLPSSGCKNTSLEMVQVEAGKLKGKLSDGTWIYLGIPYAAPPIGELRWKEPQPVKPWGGTRVCNSFEPACPQPESKLLKVGRTDEDCLYLNIWSPAGSPDDKLPVMVWIHGGGFNTGSSSQTMYDGRNLADKGVIIVTFNYRLGPLGYLCHPLLSKESPHGVSGNYGMLDQIAALKWINNNIKGFGGDPERVTVFGESAGAMSVINLMISPMAAGLFQRAISESGSFYDAYPVNKDNTLHEAEKSGEEFVANLGCDKEEDVLKSMRRKTPEELIEVAGASNESVVTGNFHPVVDGWVIPENPSTLFTAGKQMKVPLLIGSNADEGTLFILSAVKSSSGNPQGSYENYVRSLYGPNADIALATFPFQQNDTMKALDNMITQMGFAAGARHAASCQSKDNTKAYLYRFSRRPNLRLVELVGACHGLELFYVFGNFSGRFSAIKNNSADVSLSDTIMSYWANFARTGNPNGKGLPAWPSYTVKGNQYQDLDSEIKTGTDLYQESYPLVQKVTGWH